MRQKGVKKKLTLRDYLLRGALLVGSILLIVYFMPRENHFAYSFELNKPWKYGQLIAKYDFPIYKDEVTIQQERDSVMHLFQPYFEENQNVAKSQIENLREDFYSGKIKGVPAGYLPYLVQMLQKAYDNGIASNEDLIQLADSNIQSIRAVKGTEAVSHPVKNLYSARSAYEFIMQADTIHFRRDLLRHCNLNNYIEPNLVYDRDKSEAMKEDLLGTVSYASGLVLSGQKIIDRGEIVDANTYQILKAMEKEYSNRKDNTEEFRMIVSGQMLFVFLLITSFFFYLNLFRRDYFETPNSLFLLFTLMVIFPVAASLLAQQDAPAVYLIPFAIVPIFIRVFMDTRTAFTSYLFTLLLASISIPSAYEFILVQFMAGISAIYSLKELTQRSQLFRTAFIVGLTSLLTAFSYDLIRGNDLQTMDLSIYAYIIINGILLLFAYPLMLLVEKAFGFTSSVTLIELSNINAPLLRRLSKVAQGTFNHSMQVANLATEVASKLDAKVQLVRTGALYHDIGKMENPAFFTENQTSVNPHDSITEERSAQIIISHVTDGLRLAEKNHLPKVIRDFITTHHGKSKTKYFYISYLNKHPEAPINEETFSYPGPNPFTREQAILMMADAIEASSRSLKEITEDSLRELVNRIIDSQVKEGYFRDCELTFKDISTAKEVFIENLKMMYHTRISYPELKKPEKNRSTRWHLYKGSTS